METHVLLCNYLHRIIITMRMIVTGHTTKLLPRQIQPRHVPALTTLLARVMSPNGVYPDTGCFSFVPHQLNKLRKRLLLKLLIVTDAIVVRLSAWRVPRSGTPLVVLHTGRESVTDEPSQRVGRTGNVVSSRLSSRFDYELVPSCAHAGVMTNNTTAMGSTPATIPAATVAASVVPDPVTAVAPAMAASNTSPRSTRFLSSESI